MVLSIIVLVHIPWVNHRMSGSQLIDFWYSTRGDKATRFPDSLDELCAQSGVALHQLSSTRNEYLTAGMIHQTIGNFENVSIWFCGPPAFAQCLLNELKAYGSDTRLFQYDSFDMRRGCHAATSEAVEAGVTWGL